ncbi:MAG TPA: hypothetical protein VGK67_09495 [Myxococcales bacterium]|jgi:hypothetical protein
MAPPVPRTLLLALALAAAPAVALAAPFDEATGTVSLAGSALAWDFESLESLPPQLVFVASDAAGEEVGADLVGPLFGSNSVAPMQGEKGLWIGKSIERVDLAFSEPEALLGRRVEVSFWARQVGIGVAASLAWKVGERVLGNIRLQPTGRRTDDGWTEFSSGPVDFALGGRLLPALSIRVDRLRRYHGGGVGSDPNGLVLLDALEIADLGPAAVPDVRCTLASEPADCGEVGFCHLGRCADAAAIAGRMPSELIKDEYLDRRIFEVGHFFGNRVLDRTRPAYLAKMEAARNSGSAMGFWGNVIDAYQAVADAHGSPPYPSTTERPGIGMCLHLGEANRLPEAASWPARRLPMVFYAEKAGLASSGLKRGDVLTTIDDLPVDLWIKLAGPRLQHFGSPAAKAVATAADVPAAAARAGAKLGFSRCPADIAATRVCQESELVKVEVDFYSLYGEALWEAGDVSAWADDAFTCDFRFNRLQGEVPTGDYNHAAQGDDGPVRILEANGVPYPDYPAEWGVTVRAALSPTADYFVIDERTGYGGTFYGVDAICAPFANSDDPVVTEVVPALDGALDLPTLESLETCWSQAGGYGGCGSYVRYAEGDYESLVGALATKKAAVLMSMDVSGNDWVTKLAKSRPGLTRVFGPCPTFGGFGFINSMPGYLGEMYGGSGQVADSVIYRGTRTSLAMESGPGVEPDEVLYQTQSDAIAGKDTLYERAKEWLLQ